MEIGFIGLGNMGRAMAGNVLQAGHTVNVWNRTRARADELQRRGARVAASPGEAAHTGIVLTMVADDSRPGRRGRLGPVSQERSPRPRGGMTPPARARA